MKEYNGILPWNDVYDSIKEDWTKWAIETNTSKFIIGISGGKDSTCCAALATKIFGKDNVIGVLLPCGIQSDIADARHVVNALGIKSIELNIKDAVTCISEQIEMSPQAMINLPARIRMAALYAVAQSNGGKVINTCNASECCIGYSTLFGDDCGAYAPIAELTCTEVKNFTKWLGIQDILAYKEPSDGLCGKSDEENLGFSYFELDTLIRTWKWEDFDSYKRIIDLHNKNLFKEEIIKIPRADVGDIIRSQEWRTYY